MNAVAAFVLISVQLAARFAFAQVSAGAEAQPVVPNVLSTAPGGTLDTRADFTKLRDPTSDPTLIAVHVHAQYLVAAGVGGYVAMPIAYIAEGDFHETEIGNVELGGLYVIRRAQLDIYVRGAVAIDVDGEDSPGFSFDIGEAFMTLANFVARPADAATTGLDSSWGRVHGGMRLRRGALLIGAQAGVDVALDRQEEEDALIVLVASAALVQPRFSIGAGLTLLRLFDSNRADDDTTVGLNVVGDFAVGRALRVFSSLGLNLDDEFDGYSIGAGLRTGF